jgi:hypothetical protein
MFIVTIVSSTSHVGTFRKYSIASRKWAPHGKDVDAVPIFTELFRREPVWADVVGQMPAAGLCPDDADLLKRMQALKPPR